MASIAQTYILVRTPVAQPGSLGWSPDARGSWVMPGIATYYRPGDTVTEALFDPTDMAQLIAARKVIRNSASDIGVDWTDRRPMGQLILADANYTSDGSGTGHGAPDGVNNMAYVSVNGWANGGPNRLDWGAGDLTTTAARLAAFQNDTLSRVQSTINNTLALHGQGIIIWDITGIGKSGFGAGMGGEQYLGDPRFLDPIGAGLTAASGSYYPYVNPTSALATQGCAPEINSIADSIFAQIKSAGLIPGICVRGEKPKLDATNSTFAGTGADDTGQNFYPTLSDQLNDLTAKIRYAYNRWGCRIFYVDSNTATPDVRSLQQNQLNGTFAPAWLYTQLRATFPDCLLIPEEYYIGPFTANNLAGGINISDPQYQYLHIASHYSELSTGNGTPLMSSAELAAVPSAFSLINIKDLGPTYTTAPTSANVIAALQNHQCILMVPNWYLPNSQQDLGIWFQQQAHVNGF